MNEHADRFDECGAEVFSAVHATFHRAMPILAAKYHIGDEDVRQVMSVSLIDCAILYRCEIESKHMDAPTLQEVRRSIMEQIDTNSER